MTTTAANELVFGAGTTSGVFSTAGPGFTTRIITNPRRRHRRRAVGHLQGRLQRHRTRPVGTANWVMQVATFKAAAATGDTTPPTAAITAPTGTVSGTVTVTANATDNVGVAGVQFLVDNNALGAQDTTAPYSVSWDTTTATNGTHTLTALATDTSGNTALSNAVTVTVSNAVQPPPGFTTTTLVSGLTAPTDFRFLPDGRILIAQKGGTIQVANQNGQLQSTPLITLPVDSTATRGLLGIAVDPNYQTNGYVYAAYTTADDSAGNTYERLSRITVTDPTAAVLTANPASETVLVQGNQPGTADHFGGGLSFGPDGKLYFSTGDNVCCSVLDGSNSQNLSNIYGKVLRINPDGTAPADNPFVNTPGADPRIYAYGFRNPFRLTFTPTGQLLVADVGQDTWEEVNLVTAWRQLRLAARRRPLQRHRRNQLFNTVLVYQPDLCLPP